jgi:hypothetical protein
MIVFVDGKRFVASYFPFFRTERHEDFDVWGMRRADGSISEISVIVFEPKDTMPELYANAKWLINEYILEDDDALTPRAIALKKELMEIFYEQSD